MALAPALAGLVGEAQEERELLLRVGVDRDRQHVVATVEDLLRAVAMVIVDVEDRDPARAGIAERLRRDCRIVEEAIAAIEIGAGMMARRPAEREGRGRAVRSEEHTSELQSLMRISYAVLSLKTQTTPHS